MKKVLFVLASFIALNGFSQSSLQLTHVDVSATIAANATVGAVTTPNGNTKTTIDIKNISGSSKTYLAKRYDISLNAVGGSTAVAYFCFGGQCYGAGTYTALNGLMLNAGQSASQVPGSYNMLVADLDEATAVGVSVVKYTFYNQNQSSDSVQITIKYNASVGLQENQAVVSSFELSPNPVHDYATIKAQSSRAAEAKLLVYNALGAVVSERTVSLSEGKNKLELNTEQLSSGLYFASLKTGNSALTKKFIVK